MHLSPSEQKIINILKDYGYHCLTVELTMKDDRARLSSLRKKGFTFDENAGNCKNPAHGHTAPLKLRRLLNNPLGSGIIPSYSEVKPTYISQTAAEFFKRFLVKKEETVKGLW